MEQHQTGLIPVGSPSLSIMVPHCPSDPFSLRKLRCKLEVSLLKDENETGEEMELDEELMMMEDESESSGESRISDWMKIEDVDMFQERCNDYYTYQDRVLEDLESLLEPVPNASPIHRPSSAPVIVVAQAVEPSPLLNQTRFPVVMAKPVESYIQNQVSSQNLLK
jgi:hypothetical protein